MGVPETVSREQWLIARKEFLVKEKELSRARDAVSRARRELPRVLMGTDYVFETEDGPKTLVDLFDGRRQLIVYHVMQPPPDQEFCPSCAFWIDGMGDPAHLQARDTTLVLECPVPLERFGRFWKRMGWTVPFVSSEGTTFKQDLMFALDRDYLQPPGISAFIREGEDVLHAYSTHQRGSDLLNSTYNYLDITPLGRQDAELGFKQSWVRYHDEYEL